MKMDYTPTRVAGPRHRRRVLTAAATVLLAIGLVLVGAMTMFSPPETLDVAYEASPDWVTRQAVAMALNVALFIPLGIAVGLVARARWLWALVALSVTVEVTQLWLPERHTELVDIVTNSTGAVLGYLVGRWVHRRAARPWEDVHADRRT